MTTEHKEMAEALRSQLRGDTAITDPILRAEVAHRAAGGPTIREPYDALARQIGDAAYRVTDAQVSAVREAAGSDKSAFEIVMSAAVGAGLLRWDNAFRAIEEALDAAR